MFALSVHSCVHVCVCVVDVCREDLATVQEQYVSVCGEREQLQRRMKEIEKGREISIQEALDKVKKNTVSILYKN